MRNAPHKKRLTPISHALAAAMIVTVATIQIAPAYAQSKTTSVPVSINIPAQGLGQSLNELARQANLQLSFPADLVAGKTAPAVSGQLTPRQALDRLLAGSELEASIEGSTGEKDGAKAEVVGRR